MDTLVVGTRKGTLVLEQRSGQWRVKRESHAGVNVPYAAVDPRTGRLWALLQHGHWGPKMEWSSDWGATWNEVAAPKYPEAARIKDDVPATLQYLWVVAPGRAENADELFVGTVPGGLFRSNDGGASFEFVQSLWDHPSRPDSWFGGGFDHPGIHSVIVDPRDPQRILIGISCAGVFETRDGGASWQPRNHGLRADFLPNPAVEVGHDPHLLVMAPSNPDVLWQQNHCGIFRSVDGGASWTDVTEQGGAARFGFAIAVDSADADRAWVVPAESDEVRSAVGRALCVCRTDDGGRTWKALREGLPQEACYDLTFRHGLDAQNGHVAFGTTTGKLYVSRDGGDHWKCAAAHLPPIHSVRFAAE